MGYGFEEVVGKHHRIIVDRREVAKEDDARFWEKLARGERHHGEFARVTKGQETVWIEASYNSVLDENGRPVKVVKFAIDVTESKLRAADMTGQIAAISKAQAVIEFDLDAARNQPRGLREHGPGDTGRLTRSAGATSPHRGSPGLGRREATP